MVQFSLILLIRERIWEVIQKSSSAITEMISKSKERTKMSVISKSKERTKMSKMKSFPWFYCYPFQLCCIIFSISFLIQWIERCTQRMFGGKTMMVCCDLRFDNHHGDDNSFSPLKNDPTKAMTVCLNRQWTWCVNGIGQSTKGFWHKIYCTMTKTVNCSTSNLVKVLVAMFRPTIYRSHVTIFGPP
jgi:hypothetical protein